MDKDGLMATMQHALESELAAATAETATVTAQVSGLETAFMALSTSYAQLVPGIGTLAAMPSAGVGHGAFYTATDALGGSGELFQDRVAGQPLSPVLAQGAGVLPATLEAVSGKYLTPSSGYAYQTPSKLTGFGNAIRMIDAPFTLPLTLNITQPFCIEFFAAPDRLGVEESLFSVIDPTTNSGLDILYTTGDSLIVGYNNSSNAYAQFTVIAGSYASNNYRTPARYALTYDGTSLRFYMNGGFLNGVVTTLTHLTSAAVWQLGSITSAGTAYTYRGQMDEVRVSNIARYTGSTTGTNGTYTPSVGPLTADANTVLLMSGEAWRAPTASLDPNVLQHQAGTPTIVAGLKSFADGIRIPGSTPQYVATVLTGNHWQDILLNGDIAAYPGLMGGQSGTTGIGLKFTPNHDGFSPLQVWSVGGGTYGNAFPLTQIVSPSIEMSGGTNRPDLVYEWDSVGGMITQLSGPDTTVAGDQTGDSGVITGGPTDFARGKQFALRINSAGSGGHNPFNSPYQWSMVNVWHQIIGAGVLTDFVPTSGFRRDGTLDVTNVGLMDYFGNQAGAGYSPGSALPSVSVSGTQLGRVGDKISLYAPSYGNRVGIGATSGGMGLYVPNSTSAFVGFMYDQATSATPKQSGSLAYPLAAVYPVSGALALGHPPSGAPTQMLAVTDTSDLNSIYVKKFAAATQPVLQVVNSSSTLLYQMRYDGSQTGPSGTAALPGYSFTADGSSGMFFNGGPSLAGGGVKGLRTVSGITLFGSAAVGAETGAVFANGAGSFGSGAASGAWLTADAAPTDAPVLRAYGYPGTANDLAQFFASRTSGTQVASVSAAGALRAGPTLADGAVGPHLSLANLTTAPTATSMAGGALYASGGALFWRGGNGTLTQLAQA
jgi:hypothetical protein